MNPTASEDELRLQLAAVRASLAREARAVVSDARTLTDWRHHYRLHPWLFCAGAAAIGFVLAPRSGSRRRNLSEGPPPAESGSSAPPAARPAVAGAAGAVASMLLRQVAATAGQAALAW